MPSLNSLHLMGNLGGDPDMRFTPSGKPITTFSVAATEKWKKNDEWQEETQWFRVICWGKLAEISNERLSKGMPVYVEGRVKLRDWEDKEGKKHFSLEVTADKVIFLKSKGKDIEAPEKEPADVPF